jgi:hypothetical protein
MQTGLSPIEAILDNTATMNVRGVQMIVNKVGMLDVFISMCMHSKKRKETS